MKITPDLFEAFLKCPTKCWLRATAEAASGNTYAEWVKEQNETYRVAETERLRAQTPPSEYALSPPAEHLKAAKWRLAVDVVAQASSPAGCGSVPLPHPAPGETPGQLADGTSALPPQAEPPLLETRLHAVERVPSEGRGKAARFIPIRFIFRNKLTKNDKLLVAFDAFVLSEMLGREVSAAKIIHGDDHATLKVKTSALMGEVRKRLEKIAALLTSPAPPDLILNRHCSECEFQTCCRQKALEKDDLSLLSAMSEKERNRHRGKGIFTVNQLSYTFRPRRAPKRVKNPAKPHYLALQALSIRENRIHIHGNPQLPESKSTVYLDIEGVPDNDFYYLIGALVFSDGQETFNAWWADEKSEELNILAEFANAVYQLPDFQILHYGGYETIALKGMKGRLPEGLDPKIDGLLQRATNVLSIVHPHIYFPTYSNGLKDIGHFLGCKRTYENTTGLQTIAWRKQWEANRDPDLKAKLIQYNQDDCQTLKHVCDFIGRLASFDPAEPAIPETLTTLIHTEEMIRERPRWELFREKEYALEDLKFVSKCAYFDYQREKVFVRTHRQFRIINKRRRTRKQTPTRPNEIVEIECDHCPKCKKQSIERTKTLSRLLIDLKFSRTGVKRWITRFYSYRYKCHKCLHLFASEARNRGMQYRYGHGFMSWCVYTSFFCDMKMSRTRIAVGDTFEIFVDDSRMMRARELMTAHYEVLYAAILRALLEEKVLHIDETSVKLGLSKGYVWVITSMDKVYYFYKPTREGTFLADMLSPFSGVLVSDFYTAYDSLNCEQQKCLVHFVRDIDEDVLKNPLDTELKSIAKEFGTLLRTIVETVDCYGLKSRHLRKHKSAVLQFLDSVTAKNFSSEVAAGYKKRFQKSGTKMFTFLKHDGVPWNNTNAEHAIKRFARFRVHVGGRFTERSLKEYLVLASVFETCAFNNVNALKFLLSKETTLEGLMRMGGRKSVHSPIAVRVISGPAECQRFDALLKLEHVSDFRFPIGERLCQVAEQDGKWVALLLWCNPAPQLKLRDAWIGWDTLTRGERFKLIVKQARFFIPNFARRPNLTTQILAGAVTALPDQWFAQFGYAPLLAETFTDLEARAGACYKAAGWTPVGRTGGYGRFHCNLHIHPKRLWLKLLDPQAQEKLRAPTVSARHAAALVIGAGARCALNVVQRSSLKEALYQIADSRGAQGTRYPFAPTLTILVLGILAGKVHLSTIQRLGARLSQAQRRALGFWPKEGTKFYRVPTRAVLRKLLSVLDLDALTDVLTRWVQSQASLLPSSLALDGKTIRDRLDRMFSLSKPEHGAPVALIAASPKGQELPAPRNPDSLTR
jgi:predicted RecB family nuclease